MKASLFETIVEDIKKFRGLSRDCADFLLKKYPDILPNAIHGILSSEVQIRMKKYRYKLYGSRYDFLGQYKKAKQMNQPPGIIVRIAQQENLSPAMVARIIMEKYALAEDANVTKADISKLLKDTSLIKNCDLAYEIYLAALYDDRNGLISDAFSTSIGYEYEIKLQLLLEQRNIAYQTEDDLKSRGYDKTPDIKLEIPIAVDGFIINWIESKARFGTPDIHNTHVDKQFLSYWNRFGPGLVIYWFGFVDEVVQLSEKKFIVLDHFPETISYMDPTSIKINSKPKINL
ncbi:hypothetical protein HCN44_000605 [Aphidius gifuensis]|uniref:CDAN1-interacting nuclease 1 n=1 Tax=Aphidius gifuensis TaxID=684658 RepID=A0A835CS17_APHGI|nr:CDAN1-interacting nuclease 1 [Aphidius gifuensis]KAF7990800.1 hypothetical protein HCN44_000605 [Aphidius gifuensis]